MYKFVGVLIILFFLSHESMALPIDWHGAFGVDTSLINDFRRIERKAQSNSSINSGSQEVPLAAGEQANASFQTYVFRLNPVMIINDAATLKGELTTGYGRGGRLGDSSAQSLENGFANSLYVFNRNDGNANVILNKVYAEYYSETATYIIGRHSVDWGLGAVLNSGDDIWARHTFVRDGITLKFKLGNFTFSPHWAKIGSENSLTKATKVKEWGISGLYKNPENDLTFGVLYANKENSTNETSFRTSVTGTNSALGKTSVKMVDLFVKKKFGFFDIALEVPLFTGDIGFLFDNTNQTKYDAKAFIFETGFTITDRWRVGLDFGIVSGHGGSRSSFDAMYLNPNYQIAELLFRYNLRAISQPDTVNVFDSYITNATYLKVNGTYTTESLEWMAALIWAKANETASTGESTFNHEKNRIYTAQDNQDDSLGTELDLGLNYKWNKEISIGGSFGYLFSGDYWSFSNDSNDRTESKNSFILQARTSLSF